MMPVDPPAAKLEKVCAAELFQLNVAPEATPSAAEYEPEPREPEPSIVTLSDPFNLVGQRTERALCLHTYPPDRHQRYHHPACD